MTARRRAYLEPHGMISAATYDGVMGWQVYLSGEIHTDWRERIEQGAAAAGLDLRFTGPVTDHAASDAAGTAVLGEQESAFWNDHIGAGVNAIRTRSLIEKADVVVVRFGEQYRQWNAAFDAGYAAALGKPLITLHPPEHDHALKEVDRAALAVAREPEQVVEILRYTLAARVARDTACAPMPQSAIRPATGSRRNSAKERGRLTRPI